MSGKDVKAFYDVMEKNKELNAKFSDLMKEAHSESSKIFVEKIVSFAKDAGFSFSVSDLQEFMKAEEKHEGELSDDKLAEVAGGRLWGKGYYQTLSKEYRAGKRNPENL